MLLTMTLKGFCQNITKDSVTTDKETFKQIFRDLRKCDSLKVAYNLQSKTLDTLIFSNNKMFEDFERTRNEKIEIQNQLQQKQKDMLKFIQRPTKGWIIPIIIGTAIGVLISS